MKNSLALAFQWPILNGFMGKQDFRIFEVSGKDWLGGFEEEALQAIGISLKKVSWRAEDDEQTGCAQAHLSYVWGDIGHQGEGKEDLNPMTHFHFHFPDPVSINFNSQVALASMSWFFILYRNLMLSYVCCF